jgi:hypothetical protein
MTTKISRTEGRGLIPRLAVVSLLTLVGACAASAQNGSAYFWPGNLVVSRSVYDNNPNNIMVGATLPPNCTSACGAAISNGTYPYVWNNSLVDGSFGITSKMFLDQITPSGALLTSLEVPNSSQKGVPPTKDQMVTSFSSKSELALNLSTDRQYLTFMGYVAAVDAIDVSNSNTPGVVDSTNPVAESFYRAVAQVDQHGKLRFTETNAYSGNNGRAAILNNSNGAIFSTPLEMQVTEAIRSRTASLSEQAHRSSRRKLRRKSRKTRELPRPWQASTLRNWETLRIKLGKTPTSAA